MAAKPTAQKEIRPTNLVVIVPNKFIVLIDGLAVGPFDTGEATLAWAMEHSKDGIYELKELYNPRLAL